MSQCCSKSRSAITISALGMNGGKKKKKKNIYIKDCQSSSMASSFLYGLVVLVSHIR